MGLNSLAFIKGTSTAQYYPLGFYTGSDGSGGVVVALPCLAGAAPSPCPRRLEPATLRTLPWRLLTDPGAAF